VSTAALEGANRAGMIGSAVVHAFLLAALLFLARRANEPQPLVYAVDLVAAPAPGPAPRRAAEAALPTREEEEAPPVTPPKQTPPEAERPRPDPDTPVRDEPKLPTRSETTPLPGQTPSTGNDELTFRQDGIRFPYPDYLEKIVTEIHRRWAAPAARNARLRVEVAFTIQRDGTVTDIEFVRRSNNRIFDAEALGAIERAGRDRAFGPLPSGWNGESLPIAFNFKPDDR
jgi:TonB family protein